MAEPKVTLAGFMRNISQHQLIVHHDDGVYRHITGKRPGTIDMHFNVVTFPGYLAYTGDMGAYTFFRTHDMFTFFRQKPGRFGYINPHYWAEKLEATNCNGENVYHVAAEWSDEIGSRRSSPSISTITSLPASPTNTVPKRSTPSLPR